MADRGVADTGVETSVWVQGRVQKGWLRVKAAEVSVEMTSSQRVASRSGDDLDRRSDSGCTRMRMMDVELGVWESLRRGRFNLANATFDKRL